MEAPFGNLLDTKAPLVVLFFSTIFIVGILEEGAKSAVVYLFHFNHTDFDEPLDGIIYGVTVGLGFAAFENVFYTILYGYKVGLTRAVLTSLAHASFTGIFGYFLGQAKEHDMKSLILWGFLTVSVLHGIYDFLVIGNIIGIFFTILIIVILQVLLANLMKNLLQKSPFR